MSRSKIFSTKINAKKNIEGEKLNLSYYSFSFRHGKKKS